MLHLAPDIVVWLLYGLSIISVFYRFRYWPLLLALTFALAFYVQRTSILAAVISTALLALATVAKHLPGRYQFFIQGLIIFSALALALHLVPGFNNLLVLDQVIAGPESVPFTMYLNLDKPLVFFLLFLLMPNMLNTEKTLILSFTKKSILLCSFASLFILAVTLQLVKLEWSFPDWWCLFAINNALFTCVAEEAFFRGYLQNRFKAMLSNRKMSASLSIACSSILFGLAHFSGGFSFIVVATLAGLVYGLSYHWSGRLSIAITTHFAFNICHLLFFTYPLAR